MDGGQRIPQLSGIYCQPGAAADRRAAALVLVNREVDAGTVQASQGALHPLLSHELLEVAVFAAGQVEQLSVGIGRVRVDRRADQRQQVGLTAFEPPPDGRTGLLRRDRGAQEPGEVADEAGADDQLFARDHRLRSEPEPSEVHNLLDRGARFGAGSPPARGVMLR